MNKDTMVEDIQFIKMILPDHYEVKESKKKGSIHCKSPIGIRKSPYTVQLQNVDNDERGERTAKGGRALFKTLTVTDAEDDEHWEYIFQAIKQHFGERFQEVFHNTCFCHVDFTIYLKA